MQGGEGCTWSPAARSSPAARAWRGWTPRWCRPTSPAPSHSGGTSSTCGCTCWSPGQLGKYFLVQCPDIFPVQRVSAGGLPAPGRAGAARHGAVLQPPRHRQPALRTPHQLRRQQGGQKYLDTPKIYLSPAQNNTRDYGGLPRGGDPYSGHLWRLATLRRFLAQERGLDWDRVWAGLVDTVRWGAGVATLITATRIYFSPE